MIFMKIIKNYSYSNVKPRLKKASSFESQRRLTHVNVPVANHSSKCLYENHLHSDLGGSGSAYEVSTVVFGSQ